MAEYSIEGSGPLPEDLARKRDARGSKRNASLENVRQAAIALARTGSNDYLKVHTTAKYGVNRTSLANQVKEHEKYWDTAYKMPYIYIRYIGPIQ